MLGLILSLRGFPQKGEGTNAGAGSTLAGNSLQSRSNAISAGPATYSGTDLWRLFDLVQVQLPTTSYDGLHDQFFFGTISQSRLVYVQIFLYFGKNIKVIRKVRKRWHRDTLVTFSSLRHLIPSLSISYPDLIKFGDFADNSQEGMKHQMKLRPNRA